MLLHPLRTSKSIEMNLIHIATQILYPDAGLLRIYNTRTSIQHHAHILPGLTRQCELWCHF